LQAFAVHVDVVVEDVELVVEVVVVESATVAFVAVDAMSCVVEAVSVVMTSGFAAVDSPPASATVAKCSAVLDILIYF
jgi:hypothetical protein